MPPSHERVVGREVGAAGQAEDDVHALRLQTFHQRIDRAHLADLLSLIQGKSGENASVPAGLTRPWWLAWRTLTVDDLARQDRMGRVDLVAG